MCENGEDNNITNCFGIYIDSQWSGYNQSIWLTIIIPKKSDLKDRY